MLKPKVNEVRPGCCVFDPEIVEREDIVVSYNFSKKIACSSATEKLPAGILKDT